MARVEGDLKRLNSYVKTLIAVSEGKAIAPDFLSERAQACTQCAIRLHHDVEHLAEIASSVTRRSLGDRYGLFQGNYQGSLRNIRKEFEYLNESLAKLDQAALDKLNEPSRWGDAFIGSPAVGTLVGLLNTLVEIWSLEKIGQKLQR